jgi:hypothetical protein
MRGYSPTPDHWRFVLWSAVADHIFPFHGAAGGFAIQREVRSFKLFIMSFAWITHRLDVLATMSKATFRNALH